MNAICVDCIQIGKKNEIGVLNFPQTSKSGWHSKPLPWDLYAYRILFKFLLRVCQWLEAQVLRIWKPAICCLSCLHPNDFDFSFCQRCGRRRKLQEPSSPPPYVNTDDERVTNRLKSLQNFRNDYAYQQQKSSLQRQLESYLWSIPERKSLATASLDDIVSFLTWRDKFSKTVCHSEICKKPSDGNQCSCPKSLAAGTIDSNIGKLRSIFNENGRGSFWNDELRLGNPAAHSSVRN